MYDRQYPTDDTNIIRNPFAINANYESAPLGRPLPARYDDPDFGRKDIDKWDAEELKQGRKHVPSMSLDELTETNATMAVLGGWNKVESEETERTEETMESK